MIKFEYQFDEDAEKLVMELSPQSELAEVVEAFERFLRAATYSFSGHLDIVEDEKEKNNE